MAAILGITVPDDRPVFLAAVAVHVAAGLTAVIAGALAATGRKGPGRHPRAGTVYVLALAVVFATASLLAALRWSHDRHLFVIGAVAFGLGGTGWLARRRRWHRWLRWHGTAMPASYVTLLTGFYVDNGPQLPLWDRLPHWTYWVLPALVGTPLTWLALHRNGALSAPRQGGAPSAPRQGGAPSAPRQGGGQSAPGRADARNDGAPTVSGPRSAVSRSDSPPPPTGPTAER
jgi:hypothetical protein